MSTSIYVTNLPLYYDEFNARDIFRGIGQIITTKLCKDKLSLKSWAIIEFSHSSHAAFAAAAKDQTVIAKSRIRVFVLFEIMICGFIRKYLINNIQDIMSVILHYYCLSIPSPPLRSPPSPPSKGKTIKRIVVQRRDKCIGRIDDKYRSILDIYCDRLDLIENKLSALNCEFDTMSLTMNRTMIGLEQRRITDINTIQKQFNSTIAALCYQINEQINNQIKIMTNKVDSTRKVNVDRIDCLEEDLSKLKKENIILRKQEKINKILKLKRDINDDKLSEWLCDTVKLPQYTHLLLNNGYDDLESIHDITFSELEQIGINKMGHRKKILKYAAKLVMKTHNIWSDDSNTFKW